MKKINSIAPIPIVISSANISIHTTSPSTPILNDILNNNNYNPNINSTDTNNIEISTPTTPSLLYNKQNEINNIHNNIHNNRITNNKKKELAAFEEFDNLIISSDNPIYNNNNDSTIAVIDDTESIHYNHINNNNNTNHSTLHNNSIVDNNQQQLTENQQQQTEQQKKLSLVEKKTGFRLIEWIALLAWLGAIAVSIWYTIRTVNNYYSSQSNPTTSLSYIEEIPIAFPAITICNWNSIIDCNYCNLTLMECTFVNPITGAIDLCNNNFVLEYRDVWYLDQQHFRCYVFNNDTNRPVFTNSTGYGGSFSLYFKVPAVPITRDSRFGLQVTFHEIGTIPKVFEETNFVTNRLDNFFTLTKIIEQRLKSKNNENSLTTIRWETKLSTVQLTTNDDTLVVISIAYNTLNVNYIVEVITSTWESVMGEIAGIVGILMGIDALKALRGILEIPYAIGQRSVRPLYDIFN
ncbi:hypothetical protein ABK040_010750 [Willaertia magna]